MIMKRKVVRKPFLGSRKLDQLPTVNIEKRFLEAAKEEF
jgi:hypothetical protein